MHVRDREYRFRDKEARILEQEEICLPHPPLNLFATTAFKVGVVDLRWTSPSHLPPNTKFNVLGINLYRSFDSEFGPFTRLNTTPLGANYWCDKTRVVLALQENATNSFVYKGPTSGPDGRYVLCTKNKPIIIYPSPGTANCTNLNVQVTINGVNAFVQSIDADRGLVELSTLPTFNVTSQQKTPPVLPTSDSDVVLVTYKYEENKVKTDLAQRVFYRATTVAYDDDAGVLLETPLEYAAKTNIQEVEKLDWIWREAVRRNRWVLNQGGERVKIFIRKVVGRTCGCISPEHKQASMDCEVCYGGGVIGGYEGPYDIIIAPDDGKKALMQSTRGRSLQHSYDTWTGPVPLLSQRDFIAKQNGDRYGIGPVRMPSNRGMQLQQFFTVSHLDEQDIRYEVDNGRNYMEIPQDRYIIPGGGGAVPMIAEKQNTPDEREIRGSTITYVNVTY
jgi:hypothetical protein